MTTGQVDEVQVIDCVADGGTFMLGWRGKYTSPIPFNVLPAYVEYELELLSTVVGVSVSVAGSATGHVCETDGAAMIVTFTNHPGDVQNIYLYAASLTDTTLITGTLTLSTAGSSGSYGGTSVTGTKEDVMCSNQGVCNHIDGTCTCFPHFGPSDGAGGLGAFGDCGYFNDRSGNLDFSDATVVTDAGKAVVVAFALWTDVKTGDAIMYSAGTGTAPTAFAEGTVYAYRHPYDNQLSIFSSSAAAKAPASDASALTAGFDISTGASGTDHTFVRYPTDCYGDDILSDEDERCSGSDQGTCGGASDYTCTCATGYEGANCQDKTCPTGTAWFEEPTSTDTAHLTSITCSGRGTCNLKSGKCSCDEGFSGSDCSTTSCYGTPACSGKGTCSTMGTAASSATDGHNGYGGANLAVTYALWDAAMIRGCVCNRALVGPFPYFQQYLRYDCGQLECPRGDNPKTLFGKHEIQTVSCVSDGGTFTLTFREMTTSALAYNADAAAIDTAIQTALS
jgi:hypothetical protein